VVKPDATQRDPLRRFSVAEWFTPKRLSAVAVVLLVVAGLAIGVPALLTPSRTVTVSQRPFGSSPADTGIAPAAGSTLMVHVVGAVAKPGLVVVPARARVIDAVVRAGGLASNADQCGINLARSLTDGEQVVIPVRAAGQVGCGASSATGVGPSVGNGGAVAGSKVSLSRASLSELDALPGVGPALAQRIIDWRTAHHGFTSVNQLDDVSGIGAKLMASLKPLVVP
jgi:competence protein ComEA